jgi:osmotically-inducible protein OsmY
MIVIANPQYFEFPVVEDRQLQAAATAALSTSQYGPLRTLDCQVAEGVVQISGTVPSFYLKQLAQAAVLHLYPDAHVRNLVEVSGESAVFVATNCHHPRANGSR